MACFNMVGASSLLGAPMRRTTNAAFVVRKLGENVLRRSKLFSLARNTPPNRNIGLYNNAVLAAASLARLSTVPPYWGVVKTCASQPVFRLHRKSKHA